jgi:murein L,D-transpeptidase YafK
MAIASLAFAGESAATESPRATVVGRVIFRDFETLKDIRQTHPIKLENGRPYTLVVTKSRYRLDVFDGDRVVKTYPIALGASPSGPKQEARDNKTPEGEYTLLPHHQSPGYGECFYVCYPSEKDAEQGLARRLISAADRSAIVAATRAKAAPPAGTRMGGLILLHGTKGQGVVGQTLVNWTVGCVAMENPDLLELLRIYKSSDRPALRIEP